MPRWAILAALAALPGAAPIPPGPSAWQAWSERLAALIADPALPQLDATRIAAFFRGVVDLPDAAMAGCQGVADYAAPGAPFATAVSATLIPAEAPCPERRFGRLGFAAVDRSDADTAALVAALTGRLGKPATENAWFTKPGGTISALRHAWQTPGGISVVVLLEPDEAGGLVGVSVARGTGPAARPIVEPPPSPDSFQAMVGRLFK